MFLLGKIRPNLNAASYRPDGQAELTWVAGYILRFPEPGVEPGTGHPSQY